MIPDSYSSWRHCIEVICDVPLTASYIRQRLAALNDPGDFHTQRIAACYGDAHLAQVRTWFEQAQREQSAG